MPPPSEKFEITNYDVLADEITNPISTDESDVGLSLAAHSYHVGNNRLEVMCNIHNQAYSDYQAKGDEFKSAEIVEKIMNIVQNQCEPKGRFLERNSKGEWKEVEISMARKLVRQALSQVQGQATEAPTAQTALELKKKQEADAEKKRRRRSSLLRRSVSSSMLPTLKAAGSEMGANFDDKKKSTRLAISPLPSPANSRPGSRAASPVPPKARPVFGRSRSVELLGGARQSRRLATINKAPLIKDLMAMDVLLNTAKTALLPGTDLHGNNRLRVMLTIQTGAYKDANEEEQTKMAGELVKTIENFWGGRVLSKCPSMRKKSDEEAEYVKLDKENATDAMKNLLSGKPAEKEDEITMGEVAPEINIKQGRRASLKAIQSIAATGGGGGKTASILPSSLPTLPADMQHLRSAAVKSLQKRKQRQGLNSRIRGLTADKAAVFQDGSSNASVISAASGNTSPIPTKIVSNLPNIPTTLNAGLNHPNMAYRQASSGASVASTASNVSGHPHSYSPPPPGIVQRSGSLSNMSTGSSHTTMSRTTMNAARTMAQMNLGGGPQMMQQHPGMMQQTPTGMGPPVLGAELQIPNNVMMPQAQMHPQLAQQLAYQQAQQQFQQQQRVNVMMPSVPEEMGHYGVSGPPALTPAQVAQLQMAGGGQFDPNNMGDGRTAMDRNSLLNSTGSDGLPQFKQGEMDLLIKGLEMAENQQQNG